MDWSSRPQSALEPAGPVSGMLLDVTGVLVTGALVIFIGVMALLALSLRRNPHPAHARLWVLGGGIAFPAVVLVALFVYSELHKPPWREPPPPGALVIGITAHMWWWEVRYRDADSGREIVTANEIHIPVGRPVYFGLTSADVIHSFWVPALAGKMDALPGRVQHLLLSADRPGTWRGQCAEYCGTQHALMALHVVAHEPAGFDAWLKAQAAPAPPADAPDLERGRAAFLAQRCDACHTVRGVGESLGLGPDLTHVGSRRWIAAGTLENRPEAIAHWIAHTQHVKPGARMPASNDRLDEPTLRSIAAWLTHLK